MLDSTLNFDKAINALIKFSLVTGNYSGKLQDFVGQHSTIKKEIQEQQSAEKKAELENAATDIISKIFSHIPEIIKSHQEFIYDFSLYVNLSVLSGEHYSPKIFLNSISLNKFKEINEGLAKHIKSLFVNDTIFDEIVKYLGVESEKNFKKKVGFLLSELDKYYQFYHRLARFAQANLDFQDNHTYVDTSFEDIIYDSTFNETLNDLKNYLRRDSSSPLHVNRLYFIINAKLAEIDDCFNCDEKLCRNLLELRAFFFDCKDYITPNSIAEILRDKTNYLLAKMFLQLREKRMVLRDLNNAQIDDINSLVSSENHYKGFNQLTTQICKVTYKDTEVDEIIQKSPKSFFEYHLLSKFYRKKNNFIKLKELENEFIKDYQFIMLKGDKEALFDKQAFLSLKNQLLNNCLRASIIMDDNFFILTDNRITDNNVSSIQNVYTIADNAIKKIEQFQEIHNYRSYYPFVIYTKFLNKILRFLTDGKSSDKMKFDDYRETIIKISERLIEVLIKSKENLAWSKERCLLAAYMPFKECLMDSPKFVIKDSPVKLFLDSAYCKPLYYEDAESDIESEEGLSKKLIAKANSIILNLKADSLSLQFDKKTKEVIEETKNTSKENSIKNIEILGVFTALMAFIFTSTDIFKGYFANNSSLKFGHAIAISVATAIGLGLFVFLIDSILRKDNQQHRYIYFIVLILFFLFLATYILGNS